MASGEPLLVPTNRGPSLRHRGIDFYPSDDPAALPRRRVADAVLAPRSLVYVPSVGLGHGLVELLARLPADCAVLCVEVDEAVMAVAAARGLPTDPRLTVVRTADPGAVAGVFRSLGPHRFRRVVELPLCAGYRIDAPRYRAFRAALEQELRTWWRNRLTLIGLGDRLVRNLFDNLTQLPLAGDAADLANDSPVVVAGAGPSLDACIPLLAPLRRRYLLVAADTALPALAARGLLPDLVVCLEAQQANLLDFLGFSAPKSMLACELAGFPAVARLAPGRLLFFSSTFAPLGLFDRLETAGLRPLVLPPLGSVGVAAVFAALRLGVGPVVLAGLDFCYPGGRTHARGTPSHLAALCTAFRLATADQAVVGALAARPLLRRPGRSGPVPTDPVLQSYRDTLAGLVAGDRADRTTDRVVDLGGEGLASGARLVDGRSLADLLAGVPEQEAPPFACRRPCADAGAVRDFLLAEQRRLALAGELTRDLLASAPTARMRAGERELLASVDYAWIAFPDEPDLSAPGRSFLARAGEALASLRRRVQRAATRLT